MCADCTDLQVMIKCVDPSELDVSVPFNKESGWQAHEPVLLDFGRSIDLQLYPEGTQFCSDVMADTFECIEMREGRAWTFQVRRSGLEHSAGKPESRAISSAFPEQFGVQAGRLLCCSGMCVLHAPL